VSPLKVFQRRKKAAAVRAQRLAHTLASPLATALLCMRATPPLRTPAPPRRRMSPCRTPAG
jgi:hypothetical protein